MPSLIIHIGLHKTGSTSIQDYLLNNSDELMENHRILYPCSGLVTNAHDSIAWQFVRRYQHKPQDPRALNSLMRELEEVEYDTAILSSEFFWPATKCELQQLRDAFKAER